jgi:hypothetical protein
VDLQGVYNLQRGRIAGVLIRTISFYIVVLRTDCSSLALTFLTAGRNHNEILDGAEATWPGPSPERIPLHMKRLVIVCGPFPAPVNAAVRPHS